MGGRCSSGRRQGGTRYGGHGVARDRGTWEPETEPGVSPGRSPRGTRDGGATREPAVSRGKPAGGQVVLGRAAGD